MRIRFRGTNPGVWLFHCHTESHMNRGMAIMIHVSLSLPTYSLVIFFGFADC